MTTAVVKPASATVAPTSSAPAAITLEGIHDIAREVRNLRQVLQDNKQRIGCFLGAGCPLGIYDAAGSRSLRLIPAVVELTTKVADGLTTIDANSTTDPKPEYAQRWNKLLAECTPSGGKAPTVEDVLTELRTLAHRRGTSPVLGMSKSDLIELDSQICDLIAAEMKKTLPSHRCSYNRFASWIGGVQRNHPVEIFTPNYDLLFEQAFEQHPHPHFDGFVGSREPWFDLASIEHDTIPSRWTRLWKLHGSINWQRNDEKGPEHSRVVRVTGAAASGKVMIYPSHLKFDQSRRMPYLAMLDRLRAFFRGDSSRRQQDKPEQDAPRLVICGYSFLDEHLNEILLDGLRGNRNAQCFALMFSNLADHSQATQHAIRQANLTVLAADGAVIGTRSGLYRPGTSGGAEHNPWLYDTSLDPKDPKSKQSTLSRLGDFHYFALFLEQLCGGSVLDAK